MIKLGTIISGSIVGPIESSKLYIKTRVQLKKYEKNNNVTPLSKFKKKMLKLGDDPKEISNPIVKIMKNSNTDTIDIYYDKGTGRPVLSCSYQVEMGMFKKKSSLFCNCIDDTSKKHQYYYYLALCIRHNCITDKTNEYLSKLTKLNN